jgi:hypothetical protein
MHNWNTFGAWTNHGHTRIHKTHHNPNLGKATTFPIIVFSIIHHGATPKWCFSWDSKSRVLQFLKLGLLSLWTLITFYANLWLNQGLKQSYNSCWIFSNDMWHASCTHVNHVDSWLLVVKSQIDILICWPFFWS